MRTSYPLTMMMVLCASLAQAGTEGYKYVRSGPLQLMHIDVGDVNYSFSGTATVPFTLRGSRANVYLAIYTKNQPTPGGWGGPGHPAWNGGHALNRRAGIPNMVRVVECGPYEVGSGTCAWDGKDWEGKAVPSGTYTLYVLGVNNIDDGNWVAVTGWGFRLSSTAMTVMQNQGWVMGVGARLGGAAGGQGPRSHITHPYGGSFMMYPIAPGSFLQDNWYSLLRICELPQYDLGTDTAGNPIHILQGQSHGAAVDPEDFSRWWMYGYGNAGIIGCTISEDFTTAVPMEGFGEPPNSHKAKIPLDDNANVIGSLVFYNDKLYGGYGYQTNPPVAGIYEMDSHTGETTDFIDASDYYVYEAYNADGTRTLQASMVNLIVPDEEGWVLCAGGWGGASTTRSPTKIDWDGKLIYMNDAGDGFNDVVLPNEAQALGVEQRITGQAHDVTQSAEKFTFVTEGYRGEMNAQPYYGAIYGPDGAGLFHVDSDRLPLSGDRSTGSGTQMIHQHSAWDGLYILTAETGWATANYGYQIAHLPFRIESALIGPHVATAVEEVSSGVTPDELELGDAYPNPFNPATTVDFAIPTEGGHALVSVLNSQGQRVNTLVNEFLSAGNYRTTWDGRNANGELAAGGLYFCRLQVGDRVLTKKMTLVK